ncbi:hypothetical protein M430DRAFT_20433 [Amorphotheca resinae ATCC 22711]|uniref:Uncharacterized protein n=1 Tax=Amorphotheca resinae ATCC 22711 TaxID=857342 RepID=A0A2T3AYH8_AMORE|nr:hypothetical protein M430DRAFT_20433 [Amorphotheca resinae ATCC 22711]PSS15124.1 hypothetical protein M430DRAFT_20433 [Amorphotheca resinae ATCC 22711]
MEAIRGIDSKAAKPIFDLLSRLHKSIEPRLGNLWLWRFDQTTKLRTLLGSLYKAIPVASLKAILDDVDCELYHIRKNMTDHPPRRSTERAEESKASVATSSSQVIRDEETNQREFEHKHGRKEHKRYPKDEPSRSIIEGKELPELSGSDIDPPPAQVHQSIRIVEGWLEQCYSTMENHRKKDDDTRSMVSTLGGGIAERPEGDAEVGKRFRIGSSKSSIEDSISRSHSYTLPLTQISDCVYERPPHNLGLDMRFLGRAIEIGTENGAEHQYQNKKLAVIERMKAEKLSIKRKISLNEAISILRATKRRQERRCMMSGGRSVEQDSPPRSPLEHITIENHSLVGYESSTEDSISLTDSEMQRCLNIIVTDLNRRKSNTSSESSRPSAINIGSILAQNSPSNRESSSLDRVNSERSSMQGSPTKCFSPQMPTTPCATRRRPLSPEISKIRREPRQISGQALAKLESHHGEQAGCNRWEEKQTANVQSLQEKITTLTSTNNKQPAIHLENMNLSEAIINSRRRRAKRASDSKVPTDEKYRHAERERFWTSKRP